MWSLISIGLENDEPKWCSCGGLDCERVVDAMRSGFVDRPLQLSVFLEGGDHKLV